MASSGARAGRKSEPPLRCPGDRRGRPLGTERDCRAGLRGRRPAGRAAQAVATSARGGYHVEYGFSCMGYEIAGGLGVKLADPAREVVVMLGDGSYLMLNSEIATSVMLGLKLTIVVLDNRGFGCINRLQKAGRAARRSTTCWRTPAGNPAGDRFRRPCRQPRRARAKRSTDIVAPRSRAWSRARAATRTYVIVIDTDPQRSATDAGGAWWDVAVPEVSNGSFRCAPPVRGYESSAERVADVMSVRFGVSPIAWVNDDMPELGGDTPVETMLADAPSSASRASNSAASSRAIRRNSAAAGAAWAGTDRRLVVAEPAGARTRGREIAALQPHLRSCEAMGAACSSPPRSATRSTATAAGRSPRRRGLAGPTGRASASGWRRSRPTSSAGSALRLPLPPGHGGGVARTTWSAFIAATAGRRRLRGRHRPRGAGRRRCRAS